MAIINYFHYLQLIIVDYTNIFICKKDYVFITINFDFIQNKYFIKQINFIDFFMHFNYYLKK